MALITANVAFEVTDVDFTGDWLNPGNSITLLNNVNLTSAQGRVYEDVLRMNRRGTELERQLVRHGHRSTHAQQFAIEDFSFSAVAFYNAMVSAMPADELAMVRSILAGNDTFNLSPQADNVWGWIGSTSSASRPR